ncbi:MAG: membrane protein insertion efficiency factor YidD [Candidatus Korobacteraceae bacterium]|jgi:putative membrane protein insertion efficiency factor
MKQAVQFVLRMYRRFLSPMLPHSCRFVPTCSEYAMEAVERYGVGRGSLLAAGRLLRCHPFARAGYDPVPTDDLAKHARFGSLVPATESNAALSPVNAGSTGQNYGLNPALKRRSTC